MSQYVRILIAKKISKGKKMTKIKKRVLFITMVCLVCTTSAFGASSGLDSVFNKAYKLVDHTLMKAVCTLLVLACAYTLAFGNVDRFKVQMWSLIGGIALMYSAKTVADFLI